MRYIFMDNYRGFTETLIPLASATFLVGENSTGKSSFLTLVHILLTADFAFVPDSLGGALSALGGFRDIASVSSGDHSYFSVGTLVSSKTAEMGKRAAEWAFNIIIFSDEEGLPRIRTYVYYHNGTLIMLRLQGDKVSYKSSYDVFPSSLDNISASELFLHVYRDSQSNTDGFMPLPREIPSRAPIQYVLAVLGSRRSQQDKGNRHYYADFPLPLYPGMESWTWLAPIRTRPRRIYEGYKTDFTPEGDHTPFLIRKTLSSSRKAKAFVALLKTFGESSGLFSTINAHSFGEDSSAPFEVMVELHGKPLNISNVGYGVSQVLPVVVEMITQPEGHSFAIQQPEVHLHPRAQAALGDLMYFLVVEQRHRYVVETHSEYLIDRFRLRIKQGGRLEDAQVAFFSKDAAGNKAHIMKINKYGQYPREQPDEFQRFFINEQVSLLEI